MKDKKNFNKKFLIIFLLLLIPAICYASYYFGYKKASNKSDNQIESNDLNIEKNLYDVVDLPLNGEDSIVSEEKIDIPGYAKMIVTKDIPNISLMNLDKNTVYFVYSIFEGNNLLFKSDAIPPNKQIDVNFFELLNEEKGEHNLSFFIETYDINTKKQCNGAYQDVLITIK